MRYRNTEEHYALILRACLNKKAIKEIMETEKMDQNALTRRINHLIDCGLLSHEAIYVDTGEHPVLRRGYHPLYTTTKKGRRFLELYDKCVSMVKGIEDIEYLH